MRSFVCCYTPIFKVLAPHNKMNYLEAWYGINFVDYAFLIMVAQRYKINRVIALIKEPAQHITKIYPLA
jgi:hypothetical protein